MASIGGVTFIRIDNAETRPGEIVRNVTRPNVNGVALQKIGLRGRAFRLLAIRDFATDAAFQSVYTTMRGYQGTTQSWVNNQGTALTNLAILNVQASKRDIRGAVGGLEGTNGILMATFSVDCIDANVT